MLNSRGLDEFLAGIDRAIETGLDQVQDDVHADELAHCPVDSGDLRSTVRKVDAGAGIRIVRVGDVSAGVDYAAYVNFGTPRMHAQPFVDEAAARALRADAVAAALGDLARRSQV